MSPSRSILKLEKRGIFDKVFPEQKSHELQSYVNGSAASVYAGFDPTADSLHVGNLAVVQALLHWQRSGLSAVALIGGATAQIGDPSGKSSERSPLDLDAIKHNVRSIESSLRRIFRNNEEYYCQGIKVKPVKIVNNAEWYAKKNFIEFLSSTGRHFRMGTMLGRHSVESRLKSEQGMSFTEFAYQILQAYDWLHLYNEHSCRIQIGGTDQLGNMMSGHDLINRVCNSPDVYGLTVPLITSASGDKLGKSAGNAIWLNSDKTSAFQLYQPASTSASVRSKYYLNVEDCDVCRYLSIFTFLADSEIANLMIDHGCKPQKRLPHNALADHITRLVHGEDGLESAKLCTKALFHGSVEALSSLSAEEQAVIFKEATVVQLFMEPGMCLIDLVMETKYFNRPVDANRVIKAGGVHLNHKRLTSPEQMLQGNMHILPNGITLLKIGKRNTYLVKWIGHS